MVLPSALADASPLIPNAPSQEAVAVAFALGEDMFDVGVALIVEGAAEFGKSVTKAVEVREVRADFFVVPGNGFPKLRLTARDASGIAQALAGPGAVVVGTCPEVAAERTGEKARQVADGGDGFIVAFRAYGADFYRGAQDPHEALDNGVIVATDQSTETGALGDGLRVDRNSISDRFDQRKLLGLISALARRNLCAPPAAAV